MSGMENESEAGKTPVNTQEGTGLGCCSFLTIGFVVCFCSLLAYVALEPRKPEKPKTVSDDLSIPAFVMSQEFVRDKLLSPSIAEFPSFERHSVKKVGGFEYRVSCYVDSQNEYGAMLRGDYRCLMTYHPQKESWTCSGLDIDPRIKRGGGRPAAVNSKS